MILLNWRLKEEVGLREWSTGSRVLWSCYIRFPTHAVSTDPGQFASGQIPSFIYWCTGCDAWGTEVIQPRRCSLPRCLWVKYMGLFFEEHGPCRESLASHEALVCASHHTRLLRSWVACGVTQLLLPGRRVQQRPWKWPGELPSWPLS